MDILELELSLFALSSTNLSKFYFILLYFFLNKMLNYL